jgi:hypothetical protein
MPKTTFNSGKAASDPAGDSAMTTAGPGEATTDSTVALGEALAEARAGIADPDPDVDEVLVTAAGTNRWSAARATTTALTAAWSTA